MAIEQILDLEQLEGGGQLPHRGGLAAGDDQAVHGVELGGAAHRDRARADRFEHAEVFAHVALEGEHADDDLGHQPRPA